jgi:ubiquinone/menaquinone biosynthesis C-methylase UbiE
MRPWYVESFGREYLAFYSHRNEAEARADIRAVMDLVALAKDEPLLDLGCGAGRHLLALYEAGFSHLVGLDLSQELLDVAAKRLAAAGVEGIELVQADMREIPYVGHFATVLSLFTSFGYFEDDETDQAVLAAVNRALQPGGTFLIDTLNRDWVIAHLVPKEERTLSGRVLLIERRVSEDRRRVEKVTRVIEEGGEERTFHESVRMYTGDELEEMLKDVRFANVRRYGSLRGEPHCPASKRLILVAEKEG